MISVPLLAFGGLSGKHSHAEKSESECIQKEKTPRLSKMKKHKNPADFSHVGDVILIKQIEQSSDFFL
jgi:hypothetical protein